MSAPIHRQHRALEWLHLYGRRYPHAWEDFARLQADPPMSWPSWCWCPLAGAYAVISGGGEHRLTGDRAMDVGILGGLAAWRATQGIYRVHPTLLGELVETPVAGDLPGDVLTRLPEWCVYVETPGVIGPWGKALAGFWSYIEHDAQTARAELRLILDFDRAGSGVPLLQSIVHLGGTVEDGIRASIKESRIQALRAGQADHAPSLAEIDRLGLMDSLERQVGGLVSVLLYLCADDAEIEERRPLPPKFVQGKKRPICPAAPAPVIHPAGYRIGAALDLARERIDRDGGETGTGRSVTPHVRRAHWHRYWSGPREGERRVSLRWLSPILVGADAPEHATVRDVRE